MFKEKIRVLLLGGSLTDHGSYADGNYPSSRWAKINGKWYFFDENGYMKTGWIKYKTKWYYCDKSGAMLTGTETPDGYSVGADGVWIS